jgi:hypothetical protein
MKHPKDNTLLNDVAGMVETCRRMVSDIGTSLDINHDNLSDLMKNAVKHLRKSHKALLRAVTILQS